MTRKSMVTEWRSKEDGSHRREFVNVPGSPAALISSYRGVYQILLFEQHDKPFTVFSEKDLSSARNLADFVLCDLHLLSERARPAVSTFVSRVVREVFKAKNRLKTTANPYTPESTEEPMSEYQIEDEEGIIDALKADPTMQLMIEGGVDGMKVVSAVKLQGLFARIARKLAEHFIEPEHIGVLDTKFGDVIVSLFTPLAVHAVMTHGPQMGMPIPGASFMAAASAAAYKGQWIRIGLQYAPDLAEIPDLIAPELGELMAMGKMFLGTRKDDTPPSAPKEVEQDLAVDLAEAEDAKPDPELERVGAHGPSPKIYSIE